MTQPVRTRPAGWVPTRLAEITLPRRATVLPRDASHHAYVGLEHVERDTGRLAGLGTASDVRSQKAIFRAGDVLYGRLRPNLNKVWRATHDGICSTEFIVLGQLPGLDPDFLAIRLRCDDFVAFAGERTSGMQYPRISYEVMSRFELDLPPLAEQRRIVATVNGLARSSDEVVSQAQRALHTLVTLEASLLRDALDGALTQSWRAERRAELDNVRDGPSAPDAGGARATSTGQTAPSSWVRSTWGEVGRAQNGRAFPSRQYRDEGIRLLRAGNLAADHRLSWTEANTRYLDLVWADDHPDLVVEGGELVMNLTAQSLADDFLGRVCLTDPGERCLLNQRIARLSSSHASSAFLLLVFRSSEFRRLVDRSATGSLIQHLSTEVVDGLPVLLPPRDEQDAIVAIFGAKELRIRTATEEIAATIHAAAQLRRAVCNRATRGDLATRDEQDTPASEALAQLRNAIDAKTEEHAERRAERKREKALMAPLAKSARSALRDHLALLGSKTEAGDLFDASGFDQDDVLTFYEEIQADPDVLAHFRQLSDTDRGPLNSEPTVTTLPDAATPGRFRLVSLWIERFKNLDDFSVSFDPDHAFDVVLGWNGTGKSNFFEAIVIIMRDLLSAKETDRPPATAFGYRLRYEINDQHVAIEWSIGPRIRRLSAKLYTNVAPDTAGRTLKRTELPLPRFVFGYYSGPTNRLRDHFLPSEREHYYRLVDSGSDDPQTMLRLLEGRRLFCADARHAKYVVLGFFHKQDPEITRFLSDRLRVAGFESALFIFHKPAWARPGEDASTFWGASGVVRHFLERLRRIAVAPLKIKQTVSDGYRQSTEEHLYFLIPDVDRLRLLAAEYPDARSFFLALESADFSELIRDVKVKVRIRGQSEEQVPVTFREMSEGEQQLLTVLGLLRFTKAHHSLILLDEPDTHLNPHWAIDYLDLLSGVMSGDDDSDERSSSHILMTSHDPLVVMGLVKEQIHLFKRQAGTGRCDAEQAREDPKGLGFTGVLTSDMFGFASDLDAGTLDLLHQQARLAGKHGKLTKKEERELSDVSVEVDRLGFHMASSDPYYRAFLQGVQRRPQAARLLQKTFMDNDDMDALAAETDAILAELDAAEAKDA